MLNSSINSYRMLKLEVVGKGSNIIHGEVGSIVHKVGKILDIGEQVPFIG
jgi:hypothetical protein